MVHTRDDRPSSKTGFSFLFSSLCVARAHAQQHKHVTSRPAKQTISVCHFKQACPFQHLKNNRVTTLMTCLWPDTCNQKETMTVHTAVFKYGRKKT